MNDKDVDYLIVEMWFMVTVRRRKIFSKFQLDGQGRVYTFEETEDSVIGKLPEIQVLEWL